MIHNEIVVAQVGGVQNFKFHQYSFPMHMILFYNKDIVRPHFVEVTDEFGVPLLVQLWTRCWNHFYPYPNSIMFHNEFVHPILVRLGVIVERVPRSLRKLLKPSKCFDDNMKPLEHDWDSIFFLESATIIRVYDFPHPHTFCLDVCQKG